MNNTKQITISRQIVIGGKNKYMINGVTAQQQQVQNLFHSVQLNVNNPHFLIMQGRITKVLNMKPPEILSMIEEAAGTRMFETKKQAALKTIEKKQMKVDEITRVMDTDITPTLERLKGDKQTYLSWMSNNTELEQLERFCIAYDYKNSVERVQSTVDEKNAIENELTNFNQLQKEKLDEAKECAAKAKEIETQRDSETEGGFQELKKTEQELSKELVKINTTLTNEKKTLESEKKGLEDMNKQVVACEKSFDDKQAELKESQEAAATKEAAVAEADAEVVTLRERYQNAIAGVTDESNSELLSIPEQIGAWEKRAREALSQMQQGAIKTKHHKESLKELKKLVKSEGASHAKILKEAEDLKGKVTEIEGQLSSLVYDEAEENNMRNRSMELKKLMSGLKDQVENIGAQLQARLKFDYKDPSKGFNRSSVKGLVANLINVPEPIHALALEVAAGGKLLQVVVDTEVTANAILANGQLKKRVSFLPLNRIDNRTADPAKVAKAKQVAEDLGGTAHLALELVAYDEEVRNAIQNVFGNTMICSSEKIARAIAQNKDIRIKSVSFNGDVMSVGGTMTGGSSGNLGELLMKIGVFKARNAELSTLQEEYSSLSTSLKNMEKFSKKAADLNSTLEVRKHALQLCESKMAGSKYAQSQAEVERMEKELVQIEEEASILKQAHDRSDAELKKLQTTQKDLKSNREKVMKEMEKGVKDASKKATALKGDIAKDRHRRDVLAEEMVAITKDLEALRNSLVAAEVSVAKLSADVDAMTAKADAKKAQYEDAKAEVSSMQSELNRASKEIKELSKEQAKAEKAAQTAELEARKVEHKLKQFEKDSKDAEKKISNMEKQYPWIESERVFFGQSGGNYDFAAKDPVASMKRLTEVKNAQETISKKLNKKAVVMMEKAESEYEELSRKKVVILNDKAKIEAVIQELDVKKSQALQSTWIKVNRDFGSIFSTLLPGTAAKLEPLEGCTVSDGLEVKVAFNNVWKDSLTELSGGQRSLLALSLILSLLLFKPAPMYILDEVDAALDLSHTQNIGLMLRTHFQQSQFIVVSLKEGMFNNANVIFRTRFVDGVSAVVRTVTGGAKIGKGSNALAIEDENSSPQKKKPKGVAGKNKKALMAL